MAVIIHPGRNGKKPALGARIIHGHPLAQGLIGAWAINEAGGKVLHDLAGNNPMAVTGDAVLRADTPVGAAMRGPDSGTYTGAYISAPTNRLLPTRAVSVFWRGSIHSHSTLTNNPFFFGAFHNATNAHPYVSYSIGRRSSGPDYVSVFHSANGDNNLIDIGGAISGGDYGKPVAYGFSRQPGATNVYRNATLIGGDSIAGNLTYGSGPTCAVNRHNSGASDSCDTSSDVIWVWDRALTADQFAWLAAEPYAFLAGPTARRIWVPGAGGSIAASGIASSEAVGTPFVESSGNITAAGGIESTAVVGVPRVEVAGAITSIGGIVSTAAVGTPWLLEISGLGGIASTSLVGSPVVTQPDVIEDAGQIASTARVGTATLLPVTTRAFTVFIGGADKTQYIADPSIEVNMQLGSRRTCSFQMIPAIRGGVVQSSFLPAIHTEVIIYHHSSGLRLFAGEIEATEYKLHSGRADYYTLDVRCTDYGVLCDRRAIAKLYTVFLGSYVPIIARDIVDNFLDGTGITYDAGAPTGAYIGEQLINWLTVSEALDQICDPAGLLWMISTHKELKLIDREVGTGAAPFSIAQNDGNWRSLVSAETRGKFANRVIVRRFGTAPYWTDTVEVDGSLTYATTYAQEVVPTVNLDGVAQIVCELSERGTTLNWQWYYIQDGIGLFPNPSTAPATGQLTITYPSRVSPVAIAEDADSIAAVGRYDYIEETTGSPGDEELQVYADSLLASMMTLPQNLDIETDRAGLEPGQLLSVNANGVAGDFLVEQVSIREVYNSYPRWSVRASDASLRNGSGSQFFRRLLKRTRQPVLPGDSPRASTTGTRVNGPPPGFGPHGSIVAPIAVTASSQHSFFGPEGCFNGGTVTDNFGIYYWAGAGNGIDWVKIDLGAAASQSLYSYSIQSVDAVFSPASPKDWRMEGSVDGIDWTTLDTRAEEVLWAAGEVRNFVCTGTGSYRYFRLNITANNADPTYTQISEIYLY